MKNPRITILFWVLVIGFLNLVSVDAKERSFITEFLSQFEINAKMDISKNQWRSTGGQDSDLSYFLEYWS